MDVLVVAKVVGSVAGSLLALLALLKAFFAELKVHLKEEFATKDDFIELRRDIHEVLQTRRQPNQSQLAARKVRGAIKHARNAESEEVGS